MIHFLNERIVLPVNDLVQGFNISRNFQFLKDSQWWSLEELNQFQEVRLRLLIRHVYQNIPFYKEWFINNNLRPDDIYSLNDLKKLPVISKKEIQASPILFRSANIGSKRNIRMNSSGSTGEPFEYFISKTAYSMKYSAAIRGWYWMSYQLGDNYAKLSQNRRTSALKIIQDMFNRSMYIFIPDLSHQSLVGVIQKLRKSTPLFLRCYPDPLYFMANILRNDDKYITGLKAINTTGNILTEDARKLIEERFSCPVFDSYSSEGSAIFNEGPTRDNYLGSMEYAITEITNIDGNEVSHGETGMHITTDLWNYSMPLIRYNTQDLLVKSIKPSACGRKLNGIDRIIGRDNDILVSPNGNLLIVHLFTIYFEYFNSIKQFQIEQTQPDEFIFRFVVDNNFSVNTRDQIFKYWQSFLGKKVKLTIEIHDSIPLLYSGKRRFLIRNKEISLPY